MDHPSKSPRVLVPTLLVALPALLSLVVLPVGVRADHMRELQSRAVTNNESPVAHWGSEADDYTAWGTHSNRLIPVYTFGTRGAGPDIDLANYTGENSPYRDAAAVRRIYGRLPSHTVNPQADYFDQTNLADIQQAALEAGKKHIFLVVFDGMDWQTTWAAAIHRTGKVPYRSGRGTGLHFLDYRADGTSQFGYMVTSPHDDGTGGDVDTQQLRNAGGGLPGGYNAEKAGPFPWSSPADPLYIIAKSQLGPGEHAYPDSAATATAMTTGVKTYNGAINVSPTGERLTTIAHRAQERGWAVGAVSSVPISHATPAAAYAHNVSRHDYQDLTRDLLGLPSVSHPRQPLDGLDVLIGGGYGVNKQSSSGQGDNFVPGNRYITDDDLKQIDVRRGGRYRVAVRTSGKSGTQVLQRAAEQAAAEGDRLFGLFGGGGSGGHFPFQTADGDYRPAPGRSGSAEQYSPADVEENVTLAEATAAALTVLSTNRRGFWLMVEPGDVDWANHDDNLDNSIGAVHSGDAAVKVITDWVEHHSNWQESLMIVTADHGHYLVLERPELLVSEQTAQSEQVGRP